MMAKSKYDSIRVDWEFGRIVSFGGLGVWSQVLDVNGVAYYIDQIGSGLS